MLRGHRPLVAGGPQPEVDLVETLLPAVGEDSAAMSRWVSRAKYCMTLSGRGPVGMFRSALEIIDQDQVEVGGRRHFAAAELAHGNDGDLLTGHRAVARAPYRGA